MAISTTNLVPVDFETIKENLKSYLRNQTIFKDVDFEASNINVLLDVLAYNTYHNSFYLNMVASEMFIDTAQLESSVASHAKMLNYLPRSFRSAVATVDITLTPTGGTESDESKLIPKGASFTGRVGSRVFSFTTDTNTVVFNINGVFKATNVSLFEGRYLSEVFVFKAGDRYVLSNPNIDVTSLTVVVVEPGQAPQEFTMTQSLVGVSETSAVYFTDPAENGQYELIFGDNVYAKQPTPGATIVVEYRVSSGELPNGANLFESDGGIERVSGVVVTTTSAATGGAVSETTSEIKFRAPLAFTTQYRAVTPNDYEILIKQQFPQIQGVSVFGGETLNPPRFGKVAISVISSDDLVPNATKTAIASFLQPKMPTSISPLVIDPEILKLDLKVNVVYNTAVTTKSTEDIRLLVLAAIKSYAAQNINGFNSNMRQSKLLGSIDSADVSIQGSSLSFRLIRSMTPDLTSVFTTSINFGNELYDGPVVATVHDATDQMTIQSSTFVYSNRTCVFEDDGKGAINIYAVSSSQHRLVKANVGTVDYKTGLVTIKDVPIKSYTGTALKFYAVTKSSDVISKDNTVIFVRDEDISVVVTGV